MPRDDDETTSHDRVPVPEAFYRDAEPPMPARDDPHWVEFSADEPTDDLPPWTMMAVPVIIGVVMLLHGVLALILLYFMQH